MNPQYDALESDHVKPVCSYGFKHEYSTDLKVRLPILHAPPANFQSQLAKVHLPG